MSIRIYVEGGGESKHTLGACKNAFAKLFERVIGATAIRSPKVIASGGRDFAFKDFRNALKLYPQDLILLLVDSEGPVTLQQGWAHLRTRDGWDRPSGVTDDQIHLMVQCMESWFMADKEALSVYYGQGFLVGALPGQKAIEVISKADVHGALENATRHTKTTGLYHKTRHGFDILERIDHRKVGAASAWAKRLFDFLVSKTGEELR